MFLLLISFVLYLNTNFVGCYIIEDGSASSSIHKQEKQFHHEKFFNQNISSLSFKLNEYHRYDEITEYLFKLSKEFPSISTIFKVGISSEGRIIYGLKIGKVTENKRSMFIDAGIHAREWIAPAASLCVITTLLTNYQTNETVKHLLDEFYWYIIPSVNPDGYEYSWTKDRLWRKTRSPQPCNSTECCFGVDPNRNWNYHWGESGASTDPCSELYQGPEPFSEPETLALSELILALKDEIDVYISLHSYGQLWLIPYGYKEKVYSSDFNELLDLARKGETALEKVHKSHYKVENAADLYPASGSSDDWVKAIAGIKYSFTIELRPGDFNQESDNIEDGFILPADQIIPTGEELLAGLISVAQNILYE